MLFISNWCLLTDLHTRLLTSWGAALINRLCWPIMTVTLLGTLSLRSSVRLTACDETVRFSWIRRDRPPASSPEPSSSFCVTRTHSPSSSSSPSQPTFKQQYQPRQEFNDYYAAGLIGRITGLVRQSVRFSVCYLSVCPVRATSLQTKTA